MTEHISDPMIVPVENALKSLYQMIAVVNEADLYCHVIDLDDALAYMVSGEMMDFAGLCACIFRNLHPEDREAFDRYSDIEVIHRALSEKVFISCECRIRHKDFRYYWSELLICNTTREDSAEGRDYLFLIRDIHERKERELDETRELLSRLNSLKVSYDDLFMENMTDEQTGCYNRKGLRYSETRMLEEARTSGKEIFVCVLDLNGLKHMNDTYGHSAGDKAIKAVSDAVRSAAPAESALIRTGGDEFLILSVLEPGDESGGAFGPKFEAYLEDYNEAHDDPFTVSASYGICIKPVGEEANSLDGYIEEADGLMYRMKEKTDPHMRA